jgi:hypothetical protein
MEKLNQFSIQRIKTSQIGAFMPIAMQTSQRQIVQSSKATMLAWNDVINVEVEGEKSGSKMTLLAAVGRSLPNLRY